MQSEVYTYSLLLCEYLTRVLNDKVMWHSTLVRTRYTRSRTDYISNNWNKIIYVIVAHPVVFFVYASLHEALTENPCVPERGRKDTHYKQTTVGWHCYLRSTEAIL